MEWGCSTRTPGSSEAGARSPSAFPIGLGTSARRCGRWANIVVAEQELVGERGVRPFFLSCRSHAASWLSGRRVPFNVRDPYGAVAVTRAPRPGDTYDMGGRLGARYPSHCLGPSHVIGVHCRALGACNALIKVVSSPPGGLAPVSERKIGPRRVADRIGEGGGSRRRPESGTSC